MSDSATHSNEIREFGKPVIGLVNWTGLKTMYQREVFRFYKVWAQTLAAPAVTTILYMVIFNLALGGGRGRGPDGIDFAQFLAPGLMVMSMMQNSFANTSSSILVGKIQGSIIDVLMPPLSTTELTLAYVAGGVTRGVLVGFSVGFAFLVTPYVDMTIHHLWAVLYFAISASMMLSLAGVITGIIADKFDHSAAINNFIVVPLSLLSGTFYSIERLPADWQFISHINPFFYLIDGFRYGLIDRADSDLTTGVLFTLGLNIFLLLVVYRMLKSGYKLKA